VYPGEYAGEEGRHGEEGEAKYRMVKRLDSGGEKG